MSDSKHKTIFETLKAAIAYGKYGASAPMPSERALMKKFGVSRATIASVMRELARAGLVQRRLGSGTYPVVKKPVTFAVILPETERPFHAAICNGLANCAKRAGGGSLRNGTDRITSTVSQGSDPRALSCPSSQTLPHYLFTPKVNGASKHPYDRFNRNRSG